MKNRIAALFLACLMLFASAYAQEENIGRMKVVNCEEWVSLREKPDAASQCLAEIPLGAIVENCSVKTKAFIYAEYNGMSGYIMAQYLEIVPVDQTLLGDRTIADRGAWIPMRLGPSDGEMIIRWTAPGMRMEDCVESSGGFVYGMCDGMKGYVRLEDLAAPQAEPML